jgi:hypothetical protein
MNKHEMRVRFRPGEPNKIKDLSRESIAPRDLKVARAAAFVTVGLGAMLIFDFITQDEIDDLPDDVGSTSQQIRFGEASSV